MKRLVKFSAAIILALFSSFPVRACVCSGILTVDSLSQLAEYDFIAHVKITGDEDIKNDSEKSIAANGMLTFNIIELFKGKQIDKIVEHQKNTSCDIGVSEGEEWILFGKEIDGKIAIVACDRNIIYKEGNELRDWKYNRGFHELKQLRKLYQHPERSFGNAKHKEFYSNGQIEIEETYVEGKINGERKIWYPNGVLFCKQFYVNDTLDGKSEWFYPSGQIYDLDYYQKGKLCNISRLYYDSAIDQRMKAQLIDFFYKTEDSLNFVYKRIQPQYENVFDSYGKAIIAREYDRIGKIKKEEIFDHDRKFRTVIYYHDNGVVESIGYTIDYENVGHYQTYNKDGFPDRGWDYDVNGKVKQDK